MAQPLIQTGNLAQKLISALGIHGKVAAPALGELVHPVVLVEDITKANWWGQGVDRPAFGANKLAAGGAGVYNSFQLYNPTNSGVVAFVEEVGTWGTVAVEVWLSLTNTLLPTASPTVYWRDTSLYPNSAPTCVMRTDTPGAAGFGSVFRYMSPSTTNLPHTDNPNVVLYPGSGIRVDAQAPNIALNVWFKWRERYIDG